MNIAGVDEINNGVDYVNTILKQLFQDPNHQSPENIIQQFTGDPKEYTCLLYTSDAADE